jgi:hypothetical protein
MISQNNNIISQIADIYLKMAECRKPNGMDRRFSVISLTGNKASEIIYNNPVHSSQYTPSLL